MHVYCPKYEKLMTLDINYNSPIMHYYVFPTPITNEYRVTVGLLNKTVHSFTIYKGQVLDDHQISFSVKKNIKKIYADVYKIIIVHSDDTVIIYDSETGERWQQFNNICNSDYVSRLYGTHKSFIMDGTKGFITYNVEEKNIQNKDIDNFTNWISRPKSPFMMALMNTPPSSSNQTKLNWSFPLH